MTPTVPDTHDSPRGVVNPAREQFRSKLCIIQILQGYDSFAEVYIGQSHPQARNPRAKVTSTMQVAMEFNKEPLSS
ncbi:hypothetical protein D5086_014661 [Populus alba]|uniref:Uncharacterized protein n=1 Tax=Populus alba TaxID=43335 RepID=A0ACC4BYW9_POPAL